MFVYFLSSVLYCTYQFSVKTSLHVTTDAVWCGVLLDVNYTVVTIGVVAVIAMTMSTLIVCVGVFCFRGYVGN